MGVCVCVCVCVCLCVCVCVCVWGVLSAPAANIPAPPCVAFAAAAITKDNVTISLDGVLYIQVRARV